ncbi:MAG: hypothetical protein OEQ39_09740 [Gammaproteobacteria bacterium]|nr:hypothetical protein [Gammaproteobacteria bacterium]MDH3467571.1 hypothetical protein [Gammaproteobacteria bacterium]
MIALSDRTIEIVNALFREEQRDEVVELLKIECAENIPFCEDHDKFQMERIRFSVLKLSEGGMDELIQAIELAQVDWRDLFMAAGFGHDPEAHNRWASQLRKSNLTIASR